MSESAEWCQKAADFQGGDSLKKNMGARIWQEHTAREKDHRWGGSTARKRRVCPLAHLSSTGSAKKMGAGTIRLRNRTACLSNSRVFCEGAWDKGQRWMINADEEAGKKRVSPVFQRNLIGARTPRNE